MTRDLFDAPGAAGPVGALGAAHGATPGAAVDLEQAIRLAEALAFASATPVTEARLASVLGSDAVAPATVFRALAERCAGRGVELVEAGGGWMFRTAPDLAPRLAIVVERPRRLPRAVMETLAVIAMHQPCTRAEIEARRGVALAQNVLEALLEAGLVRSAGRREVPGRPMLWATTDDFLVKFGLPSLDHLPRRHELLADLAVQPGDAAAIGDAPDAQADGSGENSVAGPGVLEPEANGASV